MNADDWKTLQAADDTPVLDCAPRKGEGLERVRVEWPAARPRICNGGLYAASYDNEKGPKIMKASRCDNDPDAATGLCESCQGRETDARIAMRDFLQPKEMAPTGRARFQR